MLAYPRDRRRPSPLTARLTSFPRTYRILATIHSADITPANGCMTGTKRTTVRAREEDRPTADADRPPNDNRGAKLRVDNIHYDLTEDDLEVLVKLQLKYDRAGRSEGTAFVTYESRDDAAEAIKQFDGANANGPLLRPIRLVHMPSGPARNPFDTAVMPGRPLSERISAPGGRSRSLSPHRRYDEEDAARKGIDRYVPGRGSRSRSPVPRRRGGNNGGRRPGARREPGGGGRNNEGGRGGRNNARPGKKSQEELDDEMADYFGGGSAAAAATGDSAQPANGTAEPASAAPVGDDVDMIE
ncbi:RNA recognition motif domain-containing protein [Sarocladium implicatum]|nr:RNA recognition motif domain-containing protein [Sarocladium implicatum]